MFSSLKVGVRRFLSCSLRTTASAFSGGFFNPTGSSALGGTTMPEHSFPQPLIIDPKKRCWSCNQARAKTDVGLCGECRDRLIEEGRGER